MSVYTKLAEARVLLQNKKLKKTGKNAFAGFDYYQLQDFIPEVNVIFKDLGLIGIFNITAENGNIDEGVATLRIVDVEKGEEVVFTSPTANANLKGCTAIQSLGGVHTYMKRYLYQNALEITECDLVDAKVGAKDFEPEKPKPMTPYQKQVLTDPNIPANFIAYACNKFKVNNILDLNEKQASAVIKGLIDKGVING